MLFFKVSQKEIKFIPTITVKETVWLKLELFSSVNILITAGSSVIVAANVLRCDGAN